VGLGDVVDSFAAFIWNMEARHLPRAADLYADVLEPRIPAWDVCAGEPAIIARGRFSAAQVDIARYGVGSACRLGRDQLRLRYRVLAELSRVHPIGLGHSIELTLSLQGQVPAQPDQGDKLATPSNTVAR
jgi:hypothetical protein